MSRSLSASFGIVVTVSKLMTHSRGIPSFGPSATSTGIPRTRIVTGATVDEPANFVGFIPRQEDQRAAAGGFRELGPPDLAPLHSQGSPARLLADAARAASTSSGVSGCLA